MTITIDPEVIKARRELIRQDASCEGCGASLASCLSQRSKDPTAPAWFGCCARGTTLGACNHQTDPRALDALMKEIETGSIRPAAEIIAERETEAARIARSRQLRQPLTISAQFDQGEWWRQKSGEWIRVADMAPSHRGNTARMLVRGAARHAFRYSMSEAVGLGDAPDDVHADAEHRAERRDADPLGWLTRTALFKALTDGLSGDDARGLDRASVPDPVCMVPDCGCSGKAHA